VHISAQTKFKVILPQEDKIILENLIRAGVTKARTVTRARILLLAASQETDNTICHALRIVRSVVYDTRKHYVTGGIKRALYDLPRPGKQRILTGSQEAEVTAIACSKAPKGYSRWTLDLLTEDVKSKLGVTIGRTAIWKVLLRNNEKPWLKKNVVYSECNGGI
jgi:transposase